jgi:short-subunit dehydrogenase
VAGNAAPQRVVVITGASAGVGRAVTRRFAEERASLGLIAREPARLEATAREVERAGAKALALPGDVADPEHLEAAAQAVEGTFGPIDVWVNNAMASVFAPVAETGAEEFRRVTEVTYLGTVHGTQAALRRMRPRNHGTIVQVGSALAYRAIPLQAAYCAAKHATQGFSESLRCELLREQSGVRVTMVQLPALNTPQFDWVRSRLPRRPQPVAPIFEPELAAEAVVRAAKQRRRES